MQPIDYVGSAPLFLGVEIDTWTLVQFQQAARAAKAAGFSGLIVKIADGGTLWYSGLGGWQRVLSAIEAEGIHAVAYTYSYGNKFGAIATEIAILAEVMRATGIVIADMEAEYNGQVAWASQISAALKGVPGLFGVTTFADPNFQDWQGVLAALKPCVNFWLPQVYTNFLGSVYHGLFDVYGLPYFPIVYLGTQLGPNDPVQIARDAKSPIISFWEYSDIGAYQSQVKAIVALVAQKGTTAMSTIPHGWKDDGKTLTAPNGHTMTAGFRQWVLNQASFDATDQPQEEAVSLAQVELHTQSGAGMRQLLRDQMVVSTPAHGVKTSAAGLEIAACYSKIAMLQAQLKTAQTPPVVAAKVDQAGAVAALAVIANGSTGVDKGITALRTALGVQ